MKLRTLFMNTAFVTLSALMLSGSANAGMDAFHKGSAIPEYGKIADVIVDQKFSKRTKFRVVFDVSKQADIGKISRNFDSPARFINMHRAYGVPAKNIQLALVLHGGASKDVTNQSFYKAMQAGKLSEDATPKINANAALLASLMDNGVEVYLCGQSAAYHGISNGDLLPGVQMALSAMTAHAVLLQDGYTLNPF